MCRDIDSMRCAEYPLRALDDQRVAAAMTAPIAHGDRVTFSQDGNVIWSGTLTTAKD